MMGVKKQPQHAKASRRRGINVGRTQTIMHMTVTTTTLHDESCSACTWATACEGSHFKQESEISSDSDESRRWSVSGLSDSFSDIRTFGWCTGYYSDMLARHVVLWHAQAGELGGTWDANFVNNMTAVLNLVHVGHGFCVLYVGSLMSMTFLCLCNERIREGVCWNELNTHTFM